ncbi:MAG: ABC transporter ATP-binding protein [Saprospiraceae bacterium]|nr:ABC transporter ATP-binding protein [Saprospiraceae bacterium]
MHVELQNLWKRYNAGWIIKALDFKFDSGGTHAVVGSNGSGKSTLIQTISGLLSPSKGQINYTLQDQVIDRDEIHKYVSVAAAYTELDEELNAIELFNHVRKFKPLLINDVTEFLDVVDLKKDKYKAISGYSSGMKQRLNLALTLIMDVPLLLMDEPSSFLDEGKRAWLDEMLSAYTGSKTVIIASNDERDLKNCTQRLELLTL